MPPKYGGSTGWSTTNTPPVKFTPPSNKFAGYKPAKTGAEERAAQGIPEPVNKTTTSSNVAPSGGAQYRNAAEPAKANPTVDATPAPKATPTLKATSAAKTTSAPSRKAGFQAKSGKRIEVIGYVKGLDAAANEPIVVKVEGHDETIYVDGCKGTNKDGNLIIKIEGKFNALTINKCERCGLILEDGVSVVELVNCKKIQCQVTGLMNNWQIDKSSEINLYISEASTENLHILSSQWEAVNVVVPVGDDVQEFGFPEQIKSGYSTSKKALVHEVFETSMEPA